MSSFPRRAPAAALLAAAVLLAPLALEANAQPPATESPSTAPSMDPRAERILRGMSDYLAGLRSFTVTTRSETDVITESRQKLTMGAQADVAVRRPDRLRSDRKGERLPVTLRYNGQRLVVHDTRHNLYAAADAPGTIDETVDFARETLRLEAPAADLLHSDPYQRLTEDVVEGIYVGEDEIDGRRVHHVALRGEHTDVQLWVEDGPRPLPRRYILTSKDIEGWPDFRVDLDGWIPNARLPDAHFEFQPPPDAVQIEFLRAPPAPET